MSWLLGGLYQSWAGLMLSPESKHTSIAKWRPGVPNIVFVTTRSKLDLYETQLGFCSLANVRDSPSPHRFLVMF
jgi:hypothetical protein